MKSIKTKKIFMFCKVFTAMLFISLFVFVTIGKDKANAADIGVVDRAKNWSLIQTMNPAQITQNCAFGDNISASNVANRTNLAGFEQDVAVGYTVLPVSGTLGCNTILKTGLQYWDPANDTGAFLKKIGYTKNSDGSYSGTFNYTRFINALPGNLFPDGNKGLSNGGLASNDVLYQLWFDSLHGMVGCAADFKSDYATATADDQAQAQSDNYTYRIFDVDGSGNVRDSIYHSTTKGKGDIAINMSLGIGSAHGAQADCGEIQGKLANKNLADAYGSDIKLGDASATAAVTASSSSGVGGSDTPTCQSSGGPGSWFICQIIDGVTGAEAGLENVIFGLLQTKPFTFNQASCATGSADGCIYKVWLNFRIYGDIFLIISLLVAVIVEALGGGLISNYTVKKMIPRILVAIVLINLSIYIVSILEDLTNIIGGGILDIVKAPFESSGQWKLNLGSATPNVIFLGLLGGGAIAGLGMVEMWKSLKTPGAGKSSMLQGAGDAAGYILLIIVVPVVLAILGVLITIMFRQALLVLLLMISPVAFALYCLPNTEQYFKKWWDLLIKTLMVYPIIVVIFAATQVMAIIFSNATSDIFLGKVMAIIAVCSPLFLIPFSFKISGGVIGQVSGMASKAMKGANQFIGGNANDPNSRRNKVKENFRGFRKENNADLGGIYKSQRNRGNPERASMMGIRRGLNQDANTARREKDNPVWAKEQFNEKFLDAVSNPEEAQAHMQSAIDSGDTVEAAAWSHAIGAAALVRKTPGAARMAREMRSKLNTGYDGGLAGYKALASDAARDVGISQEDMHIDDDGKVTLTGQGATKAGAFASTMNSRQYNQKSAGRFDLGGINNGTSYDAEKGVDSADLYALMHGRLENVEAIGGIIKKTMKQARELPATQARLESERATISSLPATPERTTKIEALDKQIDDIRSGKTKKDLYAKASKYKTELRTLTSGTGSTAKTATSLTESIDSSSDSSSAASDPDMVELKGWESEVAGKQTKRVDLKYDEKGDIINPDEVGFERLVRREGGDVVANASGTIINPTASGWSETDLARGYRYKGWTSEDITRGYRMINQDATNQEIAAQQSRAHISPSEADLRAEAEPKHEEES